jgi:hypothetical protein
MHIRPFNFFHGIIGARVVSIGNVLNELYQESPPFGISRRHWNMIPQDLRGGPELNMLIYIQGWEDARSNITLNPYNDIEMREIWNRGYWRCINRR